MDIVVEEWLCLSSGVSPKYGAEVKDQSVHHSISLGINKCGIRS